MKLTLSLDRNGNKTVRVSPSDGRGFSIQTNGNLPYIHRNGVSICPSAAESEVYNYVAKYGTKNQKDAIL